MEKSTLRLWTELARALTCDALQRGEYRKVDRTIVLMALVQIGCDAINARRLGNVQQALDYEVAIDGLLDANPHIEDEWCGLYDGLSLAPNVYKEGGRVMLELAR